MPIFTPESLARAFGPIPQDTDVAAWAERGKLCARYLPRIGASVGDSRKALICKLTGKLFDSWVKRRIDLVKSSDDLRAFSSEMETYLGVIVMPCLTEVELDDSEVGAISLAVSGRKQAWLGRAAERIVRSASTAEADSHSGSPGNRRPAIEAFIGRVARAGRKIIRKDIWMAAGYSEATEFQRFQRGDAKVTKSALRNFERILAMGPEQFIRLLEKKRPAK